MSSVLNPPQGILSAPAAIDTGIDDEQREFGDTVKTRKFIYDKVLQSAQNLKPIANVRHTMRLRDVGYMDPDNYTIEAQKRAILEGKTLGRRIQGTWDLTDNLTGQVLDTRKQVIARVPHMTQRGTFINNGNEYTLINQARLRPGIFTRVKENGEIEAHANIMPGRGVSHRYFLDPDKGIFALRIGQAKIPVMPLLKAMGATDKQLQEAWGNDIWQANAQKNNPGELNKLYQRLVRKRDDAAPIESKQKAVADAMSSMELDPKVTYKTLGTGYNKMDLSAILATTKKLLSISRGEQEVDDRDHLAFQTVLGPEDLLSERLEKDYGGMQKDMLRKASFKGNLGSIASGPLTKQLESVLISSGLGSNLEEINTAELLDKQYRITRMGDGGIGSSEAVPDEARSVQPSHFGMLDPVRTPENLNVGVDLFLSSVARKGRDGHIYIPLRDVKTGSTVYKSPQDLIESSVAFPGELNRKTKRVGAMQGGVLKFVNRDQINYELPAFENAFSPLGNLVPLKSGVKAQRMAMGSRMTSQALPLEKPEAPWVQSGVPGSDNDSYEAKYGQQMGAIRADKPGRIMSVSPKAITVKYDDGKTDDIELYDNFSFNRKTSLSNTPMVRPGDVIKPGQLLAKSNYTDDEGVTALGKNLRVGYIPMKGYNFEDAIVISESAAQKLKSEHMYQHGVDLSDTMKTGKSSFISLFPATYDKRALANIDTDGVIKPGTVVNFGDPLILAARQRDESKNKIHKKKSASYTDVTDTWTHHSPGVVTDVYKGPKGITAFVKSFMAMEVGDKLSGRYGDKGVLSAIIPDEDMPQTADGDPIEVALNPLGIISRVNPSQIVEAALGKISAKTGKPYRVQDFDKIEDLVDYAEKELSKHGMKDLEDVTDPETGQKIPQVLVGNRFFMKLHHTSESKMQGRSTGGYSADDTPAKGGSGDSSKRLALLDMNALLSHGATAVVNDAGSVRGQKNEDYWLSFMRGVTPPKPKVPLVYEKFVSQLKGSGINVVRDGTQIHIMALTDKDVGELAGTRFLQNGDTVKFDKNLEPVKGGLFDPALTGGHHGNRWSAIKLHQPLPSPVFEEPIRKLLDLTQDKYTDIISGKERTQYGTGPQAIVKALGMIDIDKSLEVARAQIASGKRTHRDNAIKKLGYLKSAKELGIHPRDWVLSSVPVLPPRFRPVSTISDKKLPLVSDANFLYKELMDTNDNWKQMSELSDDTGEEQLAAYNSFKAVVGLGDPVHPKLQEKGVHGLLKTIFGSSPKYSSIQRRLLSTPVDIVGRAVIAPNPELDMDQVAIPEDKAWNLYKPFIVRRLKRRGMPVSEALKAVEVRNSLAKSEMMAEMSNRPVIINRAPVLHKYGIMAFYPQLTKSNTMEVSPLVVGGFNADFDGDQMNFHVPVSEEARAESIKRLLPSANLLSASDFKSPVHKPSQEYTGGLYTASAFKTTRKPRTFRNYKDLKAAVMRGDVAFNDPVDLLQ